MAARRILRRRLITAPERLPAGLPPVLQRVYAARAIECAADLDYALDKLLPPDRLGGLEQAVGLLS